MKKRSQDQTADNPQSERLILHGRVRRDPFGVGLLAISAVGIVLNGTVFPRLARPGGILQQVSTGILFGRAIVFTATGVPRRQRLLPRSLTVVELLTDGVATITGSWAWIVQPFVRRVELPRTAAPRSWTRHTIPQGTARSVTVSRVAAVIAFVLHTLRLAIYLSPGRGLLEGAASQEPIRKRSRRNGKTLAARAIGVSLVAVSALAAYLLSIRPRQLRWGATDAELDRPLPGDEIVEGPTFNATRAVTIKADPERIWPWLVQLGFHRAGWYSYDWDNLFRPSAERIIPELQHIAVGDFYPQGPGEKSGLWVKDFEPNRWMLWWDQKGDASWLWFLEPVSEARTRLVTRVRIRYRWMSPAILFLLALDVGDIIMMRKCMLGIKRRAERQA